MEVLQGARQIAYLARAAKWLDPTTGLLADTIFSNVVVSEDGIGNFLPGDFLPDGPVDYELPYALVQRREARRDPEAGGRYETVAYRLWVVAGGGGVAGATGTTTPETYDSHGVNMETGALHDPVGGAGKSVGRSVDEIVERLMTLLGIDGAEGHLVDSIHAVQGEVVRLGPPRAIDGVQVLGRPIDIVLYNSTTRRRYHACGRFAGVAAAGPVVNLTWKAPPTRFDSLFIVVRRGNLPGDPAPGIDNGTFVFGGMPDDEAAVDSTVGLGSGTWNYSIFAFYAETPAGWPTIQALLTTQPVDSAIAVYTTGGVFTVSMAGTSAPSLPEVASNVAAALNASGASPYMVATATGAYVVLEPIGSPPWLGIRRDGVGLARTNGENYAQTTVQVVVP